MRCSRRRLLVGLSLAALGVMAATPGAALAVRPGGSPSAGGVPKDFRANAITWVSPKQGWILGAGHCGSSACSDVVGTTDGAKSWQLLGKIHAPIARLGEPDQPGLTEVRFATSKAGWAFGPEFFQTSDGGHAWTRSTIPGGGSQVLSLAANADDAYAVVSKCAWGEGTDCGKPLTLWLQSAPFDGTWSRIPLNLPVNITADISVFGSTVYVLDPLFGTVEQDDLLYASTDGRHFSSRPVPCDNSTDVGLVQVVASSPTDVSLLCAENLGFGKAVKTVYRSKDTGTTTTYAGKMGLYGIQSQLAVSPGGTMAVASASIGSFIYLNNTHKKAWTMVVGLSDGGAGWNDICWVSDQVGFVVYSPVELPQALGKIFATHDGGLHWDPVPL